MIGKDHQLKEGNIIQAGDCLSWLPGSGTNLSGTVNAGRATDLSLPGIWAFDEGTAAGKPVIIPLFNHRNVGHKKHARPTAIQGCYLQVY